MDFDQYVLGIHFFKTLLKVTSQEPIWEWRPDDPNALWINAQNQSYRVMYTYMTDHRIEEINPEHNQIFRELVLLYAKRILGGIRKKYKIPLQQGGTLEIDGEAMYNESKEGLEKIINLLKTFIPPILGSPPTG